MTSYRPSPRPTFAGPTAIPRASVTRHVWGNAEAGEVADWIYASTDRIHCLLFGLAPGGRFEHSPDFRTVFGADEVMHVLEGTLLLANPETGEVQRIGRGEHVFFRRDTWHHAFAHGPEPLRVLEFFAPPPSTGSSGPYARTRPYLEAVDWRYGDDALLGRLPGAVPERRTLLPVREADIVWRREGEALVGLTASTEHLTAGVLELSPAKTSDRHAHGGDEVLYVLEGTLFVRAWHEDAVHVFELEAGDAVYVPEGAPHEYRSYGGGLARAVFGVAPAYRL